MWSYKHRNCNWTWFEICFFCEIVLCYSRFVFLRMSRVSSSRTSLWRWIVVSAGSWMRLSIAALIPPAAWRCRVRAGDITPPVKFWSMCTAWVCAAFVWCSTRFLLFAFFEFDLTAMEISLSIHSPSCLCDWITDIRLIDGTNTGMHSCKGTGFMCYCVNRSEIVSEAFVL